MAFANWTLSEFEENQQWLLYILWTDEAHFILHGTINTHNCRIWTKENLHACTEEPLQAPHITVWCDFTSEIIVGFCFFEEPCARLGWKTCSVNGNRYLEMPRLLEHNVFD